MMNEKGFSLAGMLVAAIIIGLLVSWAYKSDYFDTGKKNPNTEQKENLMRDVQNMTLRPGPQPQPKTTQLIKQVQEIQKNQAGQYDADQAARKHFQK